MTVAPLGLGPVILTIAVFGCANRAPTPIEFAAATAADGCQGQPKGASSPMPSTATAKDTTGDKPVDAGVGGPPDSGADADDATACPCDKGSPGCIVWGGCSKVPAKCECAALQDDDCAHAFVCLQEQQCDAVGGQCRRLAARGCGPTNELNGKCVSRGECVPHGGLCEAATDDACMQSTECAMSGRCHSCMLHIGCGKSATGAAIPACVAVSDDDCSRSAACQMEGLCAYRAQSETASEPAFPSNRCFASQAQHCTASRNCEAKGECELLLVPGQKFGKCAASSQGCAASVGCKQSGRCAAVALGASGGGLACEPTNTAHCAGSVGCAKYGNCKWNPLLRACMP